MKIELCSKDDCTGCMACLQKCPHQAIDIVLSNGFHYPSINQSVCKECGICSNVCPALNLKNKQGNRYEDTNECLAIWSKDASIRKQSSSGGVFSVLAEYVIRQNGIVYGAAWENNLVLRHRPAATIEDIAPLRRSKYVQSDVSAIYSDVRKNIDAGKLVMFVGTPCQVAGLSSFLNHKQYENLLLVDVLCQGVPSPILFRKYIEEFEHKHHKKVVDVVFRSKDAGWRCGLLLLLLCDDGTTYKCKYGNNPFYRAFITEHNMRPSCYNCHFKPDGQGYYGDLLIADFWRIGTQIPFNVKGWEKGVSAVGISTSKGKEFLDKVSDSIEIYARTWKEFATNGGLRRSHQPSNNVECMADALIEPSLMNQKKYYPFGGRTYIRHFIQLHISESTYRRIMRIIGK